MSDSVVEDIENLVARFSAAFRDKLFASEAKYGWKGGWTRNDWEKELRIRLREHVDKGDPIDVAIFCAFAWHHGWSLAEPEPEVPFTVCGTGAWSSTIPVQIGTPNAVFAELRKPSPEPDPWRGIAGEETDS